MKKIALFLLIFVCFSACFGCGDVQESGEYPKATIIEPTKTHYLKGESITFEGKGKDKVGKTDDSGKTTWEDVTIEGNDLLWSSNIDGQIGIGNDFEIDNLSVGPHTITLEATGYNKVKAKTSISISIDPE